MIAKYWAGCEWVGEGKEEEMEKIVQASGFVNLAALGWARTDPFRFM